MKILKPPKLNLGDTIGIVAPALPVLSSHRDRYEQGKLVIRNLGFKIKEGKTIGLKHWWSGGTPRQQAKDINSMFADPEVKAVMAHTGGHTSISVLEHLDYNLVKQNPKPFIGMSDISVYHLAFYAKCGLVGFHMDDVTHGFGWKWKKNEKHLAEFDKNVFLQFLTKNKAPGVVKPLTKWEMWREGKAGGHLIGGNLHLMANQVGTPYFPPPENFQGAILFWEDVGEYLYNIARSLYQLKYFGVFDQIAGMLIGKVTDIQKFEHKDVIEPTLRQTVLEVVKEYNFPILANMDFGHYTVNIPMPLGIKGSFDAAKRKLEFVESAVI